MRGNTGTEWHRGRRRGTHARTPRGAPATRARAAAAFWAVGSGRPGSRAGRPCLARPLPRYPSNPRREPHRTARLPAQAGLSDGPSPCADQGNVETWGMKPSPLLCRFGISFDSHLIGRSSLLQISAPASARCTKVPDASDPCEPSVCGIAVRCVSPGLLIATSLEWALLQ